MAKKNIQMKKQRNLVKKPSQTPASTLYDPAKKQVLHVGCDQPFSDWLYHGFTKNQWQAIRVDQKKNAPDIVSSLWNFPWAANESVHAIWSPYILPRLHPSEVISALKEFYRVLKWGGVVVINIPDIQRIGGHIAQGTLEKPIYEVCGVRLSALDFLYGYIPPTKDNTFTIKNAFTARTLAAKLEAAGFTKIEVTRGGMDLLAIAIKKELAPNERTMTEFKDTFINGFLEKRDALEKEPETWPDISFPFIPA